MVIFIQVGEKSERGRLEDSTTGFPGGGGGEDGRFQSYNRLTESKAFPVKVRTGLGGDL
jgi:hypothetical protein